MFPIVSHVGKVIGFGARQLVDEPGQPKYLNSPETAIYAKGSVLYGLYHAKQAIRQQEEALLVEGYMDVIACSQHGVDHVVAASGTALTAQQVQLLGRYAKTVVLLFDADLAGQAAARKSIDIVLQGGLTPMIVTLPEGEDPDSLLRTHGSEAFREMLRDRRQDFITYFVAAEKASLERDDPTVRATVQNTCLNHIARIDEPLVREAYVRKLGSLLGATDTMLFEVLSGIIRKQSKVAPPARRPSPSPRTTAPPPLGQAGSREDRSMVDDYWMPSGPLDEAPWAPHVEETTQPLASEKLLLRLVLLGGMSMAEFVLGRVSLDVFTAGPLRSAMQIVLTQYEQGLFSETTFVQEARERGLFPLYAEVMVPQHEASKNWEHLFKIPLRNAEDNPEHLAATAILRLQQERLRTMLEDAYAEVARGERLGDTDRIQEGQERIVQLQAIRRTLTLSFVMDGG
jgi:DNA primase